MTSRAWTRRGRALAALAAATLAASCARAQRSPDERDPPMPVGPRAAFLGSSTVAGIGASRPARRWTALLSRYVGWTEVNLGLPGSRLADDRRTAVRSGEASWQHRVETANAELLLFMYGANDIVHRVPVGDIGEAGTFRNAAAATLRGARKLLPDIPFVVLEPQPIAFAEARRESYDAVLAAEAERVRAVLLRTGTAFPLERLDDLGADDVHLNDRGHALFASVVAWQLAAAGIVPAAPLAEGGSGLEAPPVGRGFHVDATPLSAGELRTIAVQFREGGDAAVAVVRRDGGGDWLVYRTPPMPVAPGLATFAVERWRVLAGDRLAVLCAARAAAGAAPRWPALQAEQLRASSPLSLTVNPEWGQP